MASAGSIFVDLLLNDSRYVQGLNRSRQATSQAASAWQREINRTRDSFASVISPVDNITAAVTKLSSVVAGALSIQQIARYSDEWKQLQGRLNLVSDSSSDLANTQSRLFQIAQDTRSDLGATVTLYQRLTSAVKGLGITQDDVFKFTKQLNEQLITAGLSSEESAAAVYQLTQAFNKGKLDGDEFRTILESAPPVLEALQKSLGKTRGEILQMAKDGKLAPRVLVDAVNGMSDVTDARFAKFQLTITQAFTKLDNAFLRYIGQTEAVKSGTSSFAEGVGVLADNIDTVVDGVTVLATVMITRMIPSLTASAALFLVNTRNALALDIAIGELAFGSTTAAVGMEALSVAGRAASSALAFFGGPIGLLATAAVIAFTVHTNSATEATDRYNKIIGDVAESYQNYAAASGTARKKIEEDSEARKQALVREREELEKLVYGLASLNDNAGNALLVGLSDFAGKLGIGKAPSELIAQYEAAQKALEDFQKAQKTGRGGASGVGGGGLSDEEQKKIQSLYKQNETYITGLDKRTIQYNDTIKELGTLLKSGRISQDQYNASLGRLSKEFKDTDPFFKKYESYITGRSKEFVAYSDSLDEVDKAFQKGKLSADQYYTALENIDAEYDQSAKKAGVWAFDIEEAGKQASRNIQSTFADFLFDPFKDGLSGMVEGFVTTLRRMIAEAEAAKILSALFGEDGLSFSKIGVGKTASKATPAGNIFTKIFGGLFDGFHADGGFIKPGHFGIAGEAGAELIYGGNAGATVIPQGGGKGVIINQTNHFAPGVSRAELAQIIPQIQQSTKASVLEAISRGGKFSQAVGRRT